MIFDAIVEVIGALLVGVADLFPTDLAEPPAWFLNISANVSEFGASYVAPLSNWLPVNLITSVTAALLASYVAGFLIRMIRIVVSFFTAGGGAAG